MTKQPHRPGGSPAGTGGQFDTVPRPAVDIELDAVDRNTRLVDGIKHLCVAVGTEQHACAEDSTADCSACWSDSLRALLSDVQGTDTPDDKTARLVDGIKWLCMDVDPDRHKCSEDPPADCSSCWSQNLRALISDVNARLVDGIKWLCMDVDPDRHRCLGDSNADCSACWSENLRTLLSDAQGADTPADQNTRLVDGIKRLCRNVDPDRHGCSKDSTADCSACWSESLRTLLSDTDIERL